MRQAKSGDAVKVHYKGSLEDGTAFDSSEGSDPIEFTIGDGHVVPGFEAAIVGMSVGDIKTATITCEDAYGERREDLLFPVGREEVPPGLEAEVGDVLSVGLANGESVPMQVTAMGEDTLTLDANHPLAGKSLVFELSLVGIA